MSTTGREKADPPSRLLAATTELLGEFRPSQVTVRMIAHRAGVRHSLITRHFGSRDVLLNLAVESMLSDLARSIEAAGDLDGAIAATIDLVVSSPALSGAMALLMTRGEPPRVERFPAAEALGDHLVAAGIDPGSARDTAVLVLLNVFGWAGAEPWWLQVLGRSGDPGTGRELVRSGIEAIIAARAT